jgi:hypothetical protein
LDGVSLGKKKSKEKVLVWNNISLTEGLHTIIARTKAKGLSVTDTVNIVVEKKNNSNLEKF